jgi:hypothetical protein
MSRLLDNVQYWRDCADEARAIAATMYFNPTRREMLEIAESYERLAEQAEKAHEVPPIVARGAPRLRTKSVE